MVVIDGGLTLRLWLMSCRLRQITVALLVGLLTISTWYFTHSYPKSAVATLSQSLRLEILENISKLLDEIFSMNSYGSMVIANLIEKNFLGDDFTQVNFHKVRDARREQVKKKFESLK